MWRREIAAKNRVVKIVSMLVRAHATGGGPGGPWSLHLSAEQKTFLAQYSLKTHLGGTLLES